MNTQLPALAMVLLSGCASLPPYTTETGKHDDAAYKPAAYGAPPATQPAAGTRPAGRTRAEVHAEAVEAVKNYRPTIQTDLEFYTR